MACGVLICINVLCLPVSRGLPSFVSACYSAENPSAVEHVGKEGRAAGLGSGAGMGGCLLRWVLRGLPGCAECARRRRVVHILAAPPSAWQCRVNVARLLRQWSEGKSGLECCVSPPRAGSGPSRYFRVSTQPVAASPPPMRLALTLHRLAY